jgi:predicted type IV restriction endonuclease
MVSSLNSTQTGAGVEQDEVDDLQEYLPEVNDEQTKKILEEGAESQDQSHEEEVSIYIIKD